ncbi:MAG: hypothetical protein JW967_00310 [Dehalococcoidales bacterium]|nr:hypothetical protein [Dehalococcoidales bacterium]
MMWLKKNLVYIVVILTVIVGIMVPVLSRPGTIGIEGTVRYIDLEGGFWGIVGTDGNNYDPVNLETKYKTDGQVVKMAVEVLNDQTSTHQWGTIVKIIRIEVITTTPC